MTTCMPCWLLLGMAAGLPPPVPVQLTDLHFGRYVQPLMARDFGSSGTISNSGRVWVLFLYTSWCPHCRKVSCHIQ